jgi:hypothetical protein
MTAWLWLLLAAASPDTYSWWVQPCTPKLAAESGCEAADTELAEWALDAWQSASDGKLRFTRAAAEERARIRIYWVNGATGLYGETVPILVDGERGAAIYVLPDLTQLGPEIAGAGKQDRLFRHTVVYLTCLHESGHALHHEHTADFDSIMYSFGYGGDILEYFARYRRLLSAREDIRMHPGIRLGGKQ